jgi:predicted signal transduction protein with EAL and GGDEF domain
LTPWRADLSVTASLGVAEARHDTDFQTLYRVADRALYNAKNAGRDRVAALQADAEIAVEAVEADHSAEEAALNH